MSSSSDSTETTDQVSSTAERAQQVLARLTGRDDATFRDGQLEAIEALVDHHRRALVVQRTGWGKSAVYFVATALLRAQGRGPTVLLSPLIALMRDQVAAAARAGVRAVAISSANVTEWNDIEELLRTDQVDVLLISPERLNNPRFRDEQLPTLLRHTGLLVIDEAHCISDWGHDFRPDYRRIAALIDELPDGLPVLATTATANERVVADVREQLGTDVLTQRGSLARASLRLGCLSLPEPRDRLAWLVQNLHSLPGSGIIYCLTVSAAEDTAQLLSEAGHAVRPYTGRTDPDERIGLEQQLRDNDVKALVATSALGMGFDKPDLGFVVHLGAPSSPVAYYQQVGRAGRSTDRADVLLLPGAEDERIWQYFATASMPSIERVDAVLANLGPQPISVPALEARVDIRRGPLELLLKVLDVDGAVQRVQGGWIATGAPWQFDQERYDRIAQARRDEQRAMKDYEAASTCRMVLLQAALDDPDPQPCGRCDNCAGVWFSVDIDDSARNAADRTLDKVGVPIEPRKQWPTGADRLGVELDGRGVKGNISPELRLDDGRAIARASDLGWGQSLRTFLDDPSDVPLPGHLFDLCLRTLHDWNWDTRPTGVVALAGRRPQSMTDLSQRIAAAGRLEWLGVLEGPAESARAGSAYSLADVWGTIRPHADLADRLSEQSGPILLVTDLVQTRWSLTVAALELRRLGAESVLGLALLIGT